MAQSTATVHYAELVTRVRAGELSVDEATEMLINEMTDTELLGLLDGDISVGKMIKLPGMIKSGPVPAGTAPRVGFPGVRFVDGPRGVVVEGSTAFPVSMARAATWNPELEQQVGLAMGREGRAFGANYSGAVCINLVRHPAWGRAQESYGEDPVLLGQMGVALTKGLRPNVMACVKHFALNSMEDARFKVDVQVDEHTLHEVYLPHFKAVIDAGAESVMSAYNSVNGEFMDTNKVLLTDILRGEWGFTGFVTSDWVFGTKEGLRSLEAGLDIEMPLTLLRARELPGALKDGRLSRDTVLRSARRIITTVLGHEAHRDESTPSLSVVASAEHRALAWKVATQSMVLLKNDDLGDAPLLPLSPEIKHIAVIGKLATDGNMGDHGSSLVHPPTFSTPLDGLREALPHAQIVHLDGSDPAAAAAAAAAADVAIVVAGMSFDDEGERIENDEVDMSFLGFPFNNKIVSWIMGKLAKLNSQFGRGGDRASLTLHAEDEKLIATVAEANPRTAVVMIGGSSMIIESWREKVPAILHAWYPGMEGGRALADVLLGTVEPGGRLPMMIPTDASHLPYFDANASRITYDAMWGQRKLDFDGNKAAFPLGFGLGYTTFSTELTATSGQSATVAVRNTGSRAGSTVVQVYAVDTSAERLVPQLVGFRRVELEAGASESVEISFDFTSLLQRDPETKTWSRRPGTWSIVAGQHSPSEFDGALPLKESK